MKKFSIILFSALLNLTCCTQKQEPDNSSKSYFDLKGFFDKETGKLQGSKPLVEKIIIENDTRESKEITIKNWMNELELFSGSDINKPAWRDTYQVLKTGNATQYLAKEKTLRTRKIIIDRSSDGEIKQISIFNQVDNSLYSSDEELHYYPDSLYSISKKQKIPVIGNHNYLITGRILTTRE